MATKKITDITVIPNAVPVSNSGRIDRYYKQHGYYRSNPQKIVPTAKTPNEQLINVLTQYKWRGTEFGNWASQNERNTFVVAFIESCQHMRQLLEFKQLGMEHIIGVAYGARGIGGKAAAHFEPGTFMINLTKQNGFGSFAHEYGHALDYFFGTYIEQLPDTRALSFGVTTKKEVYETGFGNLRKQLNNLLNAIIQDKKGELSESYKRWQKYAISAYWLRRNEIFARWFEQYIHYLLNAKGIKNTFLSKEKYDGVFYLTPADFKRVLPLGNKLMADMKRRVNT